MAIKRSQVIREIKDGIMKAVEEGIAISADKNFIDVNVSLNISERQIKNIQNAVIKKHFGEEIIPEEE